MESAVGELVNTVLAMLTSTRKVVMMRAMRPGQKIKRLGEEGHRMLGLLVVSTWHSVWRDDQTDPAHHHKEARGDVVVEDVDADLEGDQK